MRPLSIDRPVRIILCVIVGGAAAADDDFELPSSFRAITSPEMQLLLVSGVCMCVSVWVGRRLLTLTTTPL